LRDPLSRLDHEMRYLVRDNGAEVKDPLHELERQLANRNHRFHEAFDDWIRREYELRLRSGLDLKKLMFALDQQLGERAA
jgi:hypothetical protein